MFLSLSLRSRCGRFSRSFVSLESNLTGCVCGGGIIGVHGMVLHGRVRPATNFAFGVIRNNEFHLTPVHATMQMRPCFQHIDEAKVREGGGPVIIAFAAHAVVEHACCSRNSAHLVSLQKASKGWSTPGFHRTMKTRHCTNLLWSSPLPRRRQGAEASPSARLVVSCVFHELFHSSTFSLVLCSHMFFMARGASQCCCL